MQRVSPRALLLITAATGALMAGMLIAIMLTFGSQPAPKAFAIVTPPTNTPTPTCVASAPTSVPNKCLAKATPTPAGASGISGVYDIQLPSAKVPDKSGSLYNCISRFDQYGAPQIANTIKSTAQCYVDLPAGLTTGDSRAEPPSGSARPLPQGADGQAGPPPPPPYSTLAPSKGYGSLQGDYLHTWTCFYTGASSGTQVPLGPYVIAEVQLHDFTAKLTANGKVDSAAAPVTATDGVYLWTGQGQLQCEGIASGILPKGATPTPLRINITAADDANPLCSPSCVLAPWRNATAGLHGYPDWDLDKCTDSDELFADKLGTKCSDDPWNPNDTNDTHIDVAGIYDISAVGQLQDVCLNNTWKHQGQPLEFDCGPPPDGTIIPGLFYSCNASITQAGVDVEAKVQCYIDGILLRNVSDPALATYIVVNPDMSPGNATTCPPAPSIYCGDGASGASPPGCTDTVANCQQAMPKQQGELIPGCPALPCASNKWLFAHVNNPATKHTKLTGQVASNNINLSGCFNTSSTHPTAVGNVYVRAKINLHTGHGFVTLWVGQVDPAACKGASYTPTGTPLTLQLDIVRQACETPGADNWCAGAPFIAANWDGDGDGCPDVKELGDVQGQGGLRDPSDRWDFYNPEKVNTPDTQTAADILKVVQAFGKNQGNPAYKRENDRTGIVGSNSWNLGSPDGQQTAADILATVKQFNHSCANPND